MIRLLIADDHHLFRQGLRRLLADERDLSVVAEAGRYEEVVEAVRTHPLDLAILDLTMPGRDGMEMISHVKDLKPALRILVMTMHSEDAFVMRALRAGADGYMTKENAAEEMLLAIRRLAAGGRYVAPALAERLALGMIQGDGGATPHTSLSEREFKIFQMLVAGKRGFQIAQELSLSEKTVSSHKVNLLRKMNLQNRTELVRYAIRHQLVSP